MYPCQHSQITHAALQQFCAQEPNRPPLTEAQLPAESATLESAGLTFTTIEIVGEPAGGSATRVLGAILYRGDEAWFFKLSGPDAVVAAERTAFADFLRSVRPARP